MCSHEQDCDCSCTFHLAHQCTNKKNPNKNEQNDKKEKAPDLSLFTSINGPTLFMTDGYGRSSDEEIVLVMKEEITDTLLVESTLEELCLTIKDYVEH